MLGVNIEFEEIAVEPVPMISELDVIAEDITVEVADSIIPEPELERGEVALTTGLSIDMMLGEGICRKDMPTIVEAGNSDVPDKAVLEKFRLVDAVEL
jgi:hypothetical protein